MKQPVLLPSQRSPRESRQVKLASQYTYDILSAVGEAKEETVLGKGTERGLG